MNRVGNLRFSLFVFCVVANLQLVGHAKQSRQIVVEKALVKVSETADVPAEQSGVLFNLAVREGQVVKAGETIARINSDSLTLKLKRARLEHELAKMAAASDVDLQYSKKSFDVAISDLRRSQQANARVPNSVPDAKLEKQQLERDRARIET